MRIVFLHLSDLHLISKVGANPGRIKSVVDSLSIFLPFQGVVLVVSGDIAASGEQNQYKLAANLFGQLVAKIIKEYRLSQKNIKVLLVPGNHDLNLKGRVEPSCSLQVDGVEAKEAYIGTELSYMREYLAFSNRNKCFFTSHAGIPYGDLVTRKILHFDSGYRIEANLINTGPFSSKHDDGCHYLPEEAIMQLTRASKADLSIVVMHHSPDWFEFAQKKELQRVIAQRCSIAFYGHEHIQGTQAVLYDDGNRLVQQAGGAWWQKSNPTLSEYYAGVLDTDTRVYSINRFCWDNTLLKYANRLLQQHALMRKPLDGSGLSYREEYIESILKDDKYSIAQNVSDYFVFPDLRINASKEYNNGKSIREMEECIAFIKENKYVAFLGTSNSGKTTLLKMLFRELQSQMYVLCCGTDDITGRSKDNILKEAVSSAFGEGTYERFLTQDSSKKAIIIDDIHRISQRHLEKFLRGIENEFGVIIVSTQETSQFDVVQMVKDSINSQKEFKRLTISRLYAEKRLELIKRVAVLKLNGDDTKARSIARTLEQCLNTYSLTFRAEIDFVIQFADYYCTHYGELEKSDATVFSKVFEASIENAILPHLANRDENSNDIVIALSEVAYYVHFNREYPISAERISKVIEWYCQYYDNKYLTPVRFMEIAETSGLLKCTSSGYEYRFASKDHLAYFVAKALNRKFYDDGDTANLEQVVAHSCFGINGDILMFLTYITDNVRIPRLILSQAEALVEDWSEFDINDKSAKYLQTMSTKATEEPQNGEKENQVQVQAKREEYEDSVIQTLDIYDYDISELDRLNNQLTRAFLQLKIIARNFSAFMSLLPAAEKKAYARAMYYLPNKIFDKWSRSVDEHFEELIEEIQEWQKGEGGSEKKLSREQIMAFFQDVSLNLLLNLYYLPTCYGVNTKTVGYLAQNEFVDEKLNSRLERLMFWEKSDDFLAVIGDAEEIFDKSTDGMTKNMVKAILRHLFVHSDKITDAARRKISSKYFSPRAQTSMLIDRQKELRKKGKLSS